jgi:hypothetical protein
LHCRCRCPESGTIEAVHQNRSGIESDAPVSRPAAAAATRDSGARSEGKSQKIDPMTGILLDRGF